MNLEVVDVPVPVVVLAGVAFVALLAGIATMIMRVDDRRRKLRAEIAGRYAAGRGWDFAAKDNSVLDGITVYPLKPVSWGPTSCENVMRGPYRDRSALVFDFTYTRPGAGLGPSAESFEYHVAGIRLPEPTPTLSVLRETRRRHPAVTVGDPEFHNRYWVDTDATNDLDFATEVLGTEIVEVTLRHDAPTWAIDGGYLLVIAPGLLPLTGPATVRIDPLLDLAVRMADALPPTVRPVA